LIAKYFSLSLTQGKEESCPFSYFAFHPDLTAMPTDNTLDRSQTNSGSGKF
jgi:hypothetical protein